MKDSGFTIPEIERDPRLTAQEHVHDRLRNAIMLGRVPPGTTLTMRGLAEHLDLSPTPIREAMRQLGSEGAIEAMGNRRYRVPETTEGGFTELVLLRIAVETHAATRAQPYVSDFVVERMAEVDCEMEKARAEGRLDDLTRLNHRFHRILYTANPDQMVMPVLEGIWLRLGPFQRQALRDVEDHYLVDRHQEILAALRNRDRRALEVAVDLDIRDGVLSPGQARLARMAG